ncbi:ParB/Srx family N-terminal domain-containing protein [Candidatus Magnetaquicoccus inordinatus]|uniref:ParB/Srx family N-terminal domain-containing protein n=1 Tax=Candidatus Magnetaquicoccus inordinatus TaxID=2496818 RepID=UPI00102B8F30|nr:ParB/Srx family N-terminal domain-containing protein [Candidatus Magnetaquicoccus inordinatus]
MKKNHHQHLEVGDIFELPVEKIRPTQFSIGLVSVDCKRRQIEKEMAHERLDEFLRQEGRLVPVVLGPNRELFITDHHHLSTAIWRADIPHGHKYVYGYILQDWSEKDGDHFWRDMIENHYTWLYDDKGEGPLNPYLLPKSIGDILNDPYRTLSRWLRDCGCYTKDSLKEKTHVVDISEKYLPSSQAKAFFIEFRWANFLRANVKLALKKADYSMTCATMPYSSLYLTKEVDALIQAFDIVVSLIGCKQLQEVTYDKDGCLVKAGHVDHPHRRLTDPEMAEDGHLQ